MAQHFCTPHLGDGTPSADIHESHKQLRSVPDGEQQENPVSSVHVCDIPFRQLVCKYGIVYARHVATALLQQDKMADGSMLGCSEASALHRP